MQPLLVLSQFAAKVSVVAGIAWYLVTSIFKDNVPDFVYRHILPIAFAVSFIGFAVDGIYIYPNYRSPLRHLPLIKARGRDELRMLMESPRGATPLKWMDANPGADLLLIRNDINESNLVLVSPRALRDVLSTNTYDFEKPWGIRAFLARVIGFGLILSEGADHKKQRKSLTPAFNIKKIRDLYGLMWEKVGILLEELEKDIKAHPASSKYGEEDGDKGLVEISEWGSRLTLDIIGPTAMGRDFRSLTSESNPIAQAFLELLEPNNERLLFLGAHFIIPEPIMKRIPFPFRGINKMLNRNEAFLRGTCHNIIDQKKFELLRNKEAKDYDILSTIMQTKEFTDSELVDQMLTFLAAGHETTASALTWCSYLLSKNPHVQSKLRAEIRQMIPSASSSISWDLLESMPYLNGVCEETLRLYPTVPTTIREAVRDTTIAGTQVPKDTLVIIVPYATNRHRDAWGDDADQMVPERWIDTAPDGTRRPNKHGGAPSNFSEITFLHGARACIGRDFAKAELRCAIAGVFGRFHVELENPDTEIKISGVITTKPVNGMKLKMKLVDGW